VKIVIVDDHPVVRKGLKTILEENEYIVCGEAEDGNTAVKVVADTEPDLAIVDIELKGGVNGIELISALKTRFSRLPILVMSMDDGTLYAERSIQAGAKGYVTKAEASDNIINAIETVMSGKLFLSRSISEKIAGKHILGSVDDSEINVSLLSPREFEIFSLLGKGYKRNEISKNLGMNINTIESHRRNIRDKLNLKDSSEITKAAVRWVVKEKPH
jgi:DNA-binding NarL/FixJ family response regulator